MREEVAGIARPVGVRLRGRKALGAEKPLPHPGHPGKATCLNCSNTRNTPWFQVSHLCVPEAGRSKSKEPYSRGTTPEAEGLAHRGASLPHKDLNLDIQDLVPVFLNIMLCNRHLISV